MRTSSSASFQPLPGVSCRSRVGPLKGSKPQKPVMVPVMVLVVASLVVAETASAVLPVAGDALGQCRAVEVCVQGSFARTRPPRKASGVTGMSAVDARAFEAEFEVVGEGGGEDEGGAIDCEYDRGLEEAGDVFGVGWLQRRGTAAWMEGRPMTMTDLGSLKEGGVLRRRLRLSFFGEGDGGNVLIFGGVEAAHDADEVDDGTDVGAVEASAPDAGVAGLVDEVGVGSAAEHGDDGLAVAVVEEGLVAGLGEAGGLGIGRTFEAVAVGLEVEGAGEEVGVFGERLGIVGGTRRMAAR